LAGLLLFIIVVLIAFVFYMTAMPGKSFSGVLPPLAAEEIQIKTNLTTHISYLADEIGERNVFAYESLQKTAQYIEDNFKKFRYEVQSQEFTVQMRKVRNLIAEIPGGAKANEIVVIGAHYDTVYDCPGADDNSSGVAALLELARLLKESHPARTVRFVAFVNEEPPWFQTDDMGSLVYAEQAHKLKENIVAAISIETIGMYSDAKGSQQYPAGFKSLYPSKGDFIAFIGNVGSLGLVRDAVRSFRASTRFPSEGSAVPAAIPGVGWSDQWAFWEQGYPAIMVTDTATFRNPNYHQPTDKPDTLDYDRMARVVLGLAGVVHALAK